ncbi:MmgE/PrpD family protein [Salipiger abyssi]|uniref:MmgE/PrpD family protein n=1 Tax=Salipiger abyssi TaxID=1250539 RepID=UPI0040582B6A
MQAKSDVAFPFAETALARSYGDLSGATVAATQAALTDTLACALAGTNAPGVGEARAGFGRQWPGGTVTVWGGFGKAMGPMAAVMNAASLHALDYDDTDDKVPLHANSVLLPALMAYMEERGIACDGKDFLTALAVGIDGAMRIGRAGGPKARKGWNYSVISGGIGTILALGHLGKWDTQTTVNALGHQLAQTSGSLQSIIDGSLAKRFQPAMLAKDTLFAAALAEAGVDGPRNVFEGRAGFWALYQDGEWDRDVMLTGMESCSMVTDLSLKPYPTCRFTHASIDVGIEMHRQGLRPEQIKRLKIMPSGQAVNMTGRDFDHTKAGVVDAQFSVAYSTSVALAQGAMKIDDITIDRIRQSPVGAFVAEKVVVEANPEVDFLSMSPVVVEAELTSGEIRRFDGPDVSGSPEKPLTRDQLFDKVADCLGSNDAAVSAEELMASVDTLPGAASMAPVMDLLARPSTRAKHSAVA